MRAKPESTNNAYKSRASSLIVLVESELSHFISYHFIFIKIPWRQKANCDILTLKIYILIFLHSYIKRYKTTVDKLL